MAIFSAKKALVAVFVAVFMMGSLWHHKAEAVIVEQDAYHVYHITPYSQYFSNNENLVKTIKSTFTVVKDLLEEVRDREALANNDTEIEVNLEEAEEVSPEQALIENLIAEHNEQKELQRALDVVNVFIEDSKETVRMLNWSDAIPDAFMVYTSFKAFGRIFAKLGPAIAIIVMPIKVRRIEKATGLMNSYTSFKVAFTLIGNGDLGFGLNKNKALAEKQAKQQKWRAGVGLIWGTDHFSLPEQFWGANIAFSSGIRVLGKEMNAKLGTVTSPSIPGLVDFVYSSIGFDLKQLFGKAQTDQVPLKFEVHGNAAAIIPAEAVLTSWQNSASSVLKSTSRSIEQRLTTAARSSIVDTPPRRRTPVRKPPRRKPPVKKPDPDLDGENTSPGPQPLAE